MSRRRWVVGRIAAQRFTAGAVVAGPLVAAVGLGLPGLTLPHAAPWQARLLMLTGMVTAVLAAVGGTAMMVTATATQIFALTALGVLVRHRPASLVLASAGALVLAGYLLAADLSMLRWPRRTLHRRIWPVIPIVLGATGAVAGASMLPTTASPVAVLAGLVGVVIGYAVAVSRQPRQPPREPR